MSDKRIDDFTIHRYEGNDENFIAVTDITHEGYCKIERKKRDQLLADSDWTQVPDAPVDQAAWATYRQALRDVPQQTGFPTDINWPAKPNE